MRAPNRLIKWRLRLRLTQTSAAERLGVSQSALSDYESGKKEPRVRVALRIERETAGYVSLESWNSAA